MTDEPLLPSVNDKVGPETQSQRAARYKKMRSEAEADLSKMLAEFPKSMLAKTLRDERLRDERMEPIRKAFIDASKKAKR